MPSCAKGKATPVLALAGALSALVVVGGVSPALASGTSAAGSAPPSTDPYVASLAYAHCLRQHGVPHPDPDKNGDFHLTPAQEQRIIRVSPAKRRAAENACFHLLQGLNLKPLSHRAIARANEVIADLGRCMRGHGHEVGAPNAKNLGRGTASFGFKPVKRPPGYWEGPAGKRYIKDLHTCEKRVDFARRLTKIIKADRISGKDL